MLEARWRQTYSDLANPPPIRFRFRSVFGNGGRKYLIGGRDGEIPAISQAEIQAKAMAMGVRRANGGKGMV
jgi:hypothetical protein